MNAWQFLRSLNELCHFQTREGKRVGSASNSELKRWCQSKAFIINGEAVAWDEPVDFPVFSVVLFPKHPVTLL
jgi:ATP-dependent DNA ligase